MILTFETHANPALLCDSTADLGEARELAENKTMTTVGTRGYTAPEVLRGEHYGTPADVYSFAIMASELFTLKPPYSDSRKCSNEKRELAL